MVRGYDFGFIAGIGTVLQHPECQVISHPLATLPVPSTGWGGRGRTAVLLSGESDRGGLEG
jgi:hypothetical protein